MAVSDLARLDSTRIEHNMQRQRDRETGRRATVYMYIYDMHTQRQTFRDRERKRLLDSHALEVVRLAVDAIEEGGAGMAVCVVC